MKIVFYAFLCFIFSFDQYFDLTMIFYVFIYVRCIVKYFMMFYYIIFVSLLYIVFMSINRKTILFYCTLCFITNVF